MQTIPPRFSNSRRAALAAALAGAFGLAGCAGPRAPAAGTAGAPVAATPATSTAATPAGTVAVMTSGAFTAAYKELTPTFEQRSGLRVQTAYGASLGNAPDSIPSRLSRGEPADVVILARSALDQLVAQGRVVAGSQVDLVRSPIGMAVKKGAPRPDISSVPALKAALLAAPSIAYSASASGTYYETEMLKLLGLEAQVRPKSRRILSERVGTVVARGDAALGLQQVSELLPIEGIDFIGVLPPEVQRVTVFSAGISSTARNPEGARALIRYFTTAEAAPAIRRSGLEPAGGSSGLLPTGAAR